MGAAAPPRPGEPDLGPPDGAKELRVDLAQGSCRGPANGCVLVFDQCPAEGGDGLRCFQLTKGPGSIGPDAGRRILQGTDQGRQPFDSLNLPGGHG